MENDVTYMHTIPALRNKVILPFAFFLTFFVGIVVGLIIDKSNPQYTDQQGSQILSNDLAIYSSSESCKLITMINLSVVEHGDFCEATVGTSFRVSYPKMWSSETIGAYAANLAIMNESGDTVARIFQFMMNTAIEQLSIEQYDELSFAPYPDDTSVRHSPFIGSIETKIVQKELVQLNNKQSLRTQIIDENGEMALYYLSDNGNTNPDDIIVYVIRFEKNISEQNQNLILNSFESIN